MPSVSFVESLNAFRHLIKSSVVSALHRVRLAKLSTASRASVMCVEDQGARAVPLCPMTRWKRPLLLGDKARKLTEAAPAELPNIVTREESPPKWQMFSFI